MTMDQIIQIITIKEVAIATLITVLASIVESILKNAYEKSKRAIAAQITPKKDPTKKEGSAIPPTFIRERTLSTLYLISLFIPVIIFIYRIIEPLFQINKLIPTKIYIYTIIYLIALVLWIGFAMYSYSGFLKIDQRIQEKKIKLLDNRLAILELLSSNQFNNKGTTFKDK